MYLLLHAVAFVHCSNGTAHFEKCKQLLKYQNLCLLSLRQLLSCIGVYYILPYWVVILTQRVDSWNGTQEYLLWSYLQIAEKACLGRTTDLILEELVNYQKVNEFWSFPVLAHFFG